MADAKYLQKRGSGSLHRRFETEQRLQVLRIPTLIRILVPGNECIVSWIAGNDFFGAPLPGRP